MDFHAVYPPGLTAGSHKSSSTTIVIIGAAVGASVLFLLLLILAGVYALRQKRRAETASKNSDPFGMVQIYHLA